MIAVVAALTAAAAWSSARVGVSANVDELLPHDSEVVSLMKEYGQTREQTDWLILLAEGEALFAPAALAALQGAIEQIETRPEVTATIDPYRFISFVRAGGRLLFEPAAPGGTAPADAAAVELFRQRLAADPLARGLVVSDDGAALGVLFNVPLRADYRPLLAAVGEAVRPLRDAGVEVSLAGMPTIDAATREHLTRDLPLLLVVSVAVIMAIYYASFRSLAATILPVLVVAIATVWTVGTMSALGLDFTIVSVTTPPFVMTLGSVYSVHILTAYLLPTVGGGNGVRAPFAATGPRQPLLLVGRRPWRDRGDGGAGRRHHGRRVRRSGHRVDRRGARVRGDHRIGDCLLRAACAAVPAGLRAGAGCAAARGAQRRIEGA